MIRRAAQGEIVRRNLQVVGAEAAQLDIADTVVPLRIGVYRDSKIEFARLVSKVCLEVGIVPHLDILAQRSLNQKMEIPVTRTETEHEERVHMVFVTARRL